MIPLEMLRKGDCFIATELYGVESVQVAVLHRLRDQGLLRSRLGAKLVDGYYLWVPKTSSAAVEDGYPLATSHSAV